MTRPSRVWRALRWGLAAGVLAFGLWAGLPAMGWLQRRPAVDGLPTVTVTQGNFERTVAATGTFELLEYVDVGAQLSGQLKTVTVGLGEVVRRGQRLATIDDTTARARLAQTEAALASMRAQIAAKQTQSALARTQRDRSARLVERGLLAVATLEEAAAHLASLQAETESLQAQAASLAAVIKQATTELRFAEVRAPMDGLVIALVARPGQALNATQQAPVILRIGNLESLVLIASVSEADIVQVHLSMEAHLQLLGVPDRRFAGRVRKILPTPKVVNSVVFYEVVVEPRQREDLFRIGMTAQVSFVIVRHACMLKIPRSVLPVDLHPPQTVRLAVLGTDRLPRDLDVEVTAADDLEGGVPCEQASRAGLEDGMHIVMPSRASKKEERS